MDDFLPFPSRDYFLMLALLIVCRGMDILSTWVATPNLVLEGNPIAKKLGWRWGLPINLGFALILAFWPLPAIVISTTSVLVAARNFQSAWLMRSLGEQAYRDWHVERIQETHAMRYFFVPDLEAALQATGFNAIEWGEWLTGLPPTRESFGVYVVALAV